MTILGRINLSSIFLGGETYVAPHRGEGDRLVAQNAPRSVTGDLFK
ncbi:hypothetical protein OROMI_002799 [Orobanche minor]